ncbi:uncharacterized protein LOC143980678 isoform X1 [Lithobates pipiens]
MDHQQGKILTDSGPDENVSGIPGGFRATEVSSTPEQGRGYNFSGPFSVRGKDISIQRDYEGAGPDDGSYPSSSLGTAALQDPPALPPFLLGQERGFSRSRSGHSDRGKGFSSLVASPSEASGGPPLESASAAQDNNRRKFLGVGGPPGGSNSPGFLGRESEKDILKFSRTFGHRGGIKGFRKEDQGPGSSGPIRQRHGSGICQSSGGHQISNSTGSIFRDHGLGGASDYLHFRSPHKGVPECRGRLSQSSADSSGRMGVESRGILPGMSAVRRSRDRSVRPQKEQKGKEILFPCPRGGLRGDRRLGPGLGLPVGLCLPPHGAYSEGSSKAVSLGRRPDSDSSLVAQESLVSSPAGLVHSPASTPSCSARPSPSGSSLPSRPQLLQADGLALERQNLREKGLSDRVVDTLLLSRKPVTRRIYAKTWGIFSRWCQVRGTSQQEIPAILEFLQDGAEQGLATKTLKAQVAALSCFLERRLALDPLIKRFLLVRERLSPVQVSRFPPWDLTLVLEGLTRPPFEPIDQIPLRILTFKLAFLLAITSARRVGDIQAFSVKEPYFRLFEDRVILRQDPLYLPKVASRFHRSQEVVLPSFCNNPQNEREISFHCLDVRRCLLSYLEKVKEFRRSSHLLVNFSGQKKGQQASKASIARWIKHAIALAYEQSGNAVPRDLKAHSTRSLATSWAERAGASVEQICRAATWTSQNTFLRHYRVELLSPQDLAFGRKVLQAVVPP